MGLPARKNGGRAVGPASGRAAPTEPPPPVTGPGTKGKWHEAAPAAGGGGAGAGPARLECVKLFFRNGMNQRLLPPLRLRVFAREFSLFSAVLRGAMMYSIEDQRVKAG